MEIIHPSGEAYDLASGSKLEITRANPFFNDIGEQSLPISLPLTPKNSRLLQFPNRLDHNTRPVKELDVIVRHGIFNQQCRQAVFGVDASSVDTAFYLNTGDFYTRLKEITINDVFGDTVWDYGYVGILLDSMWKWYVRGSDTFAVFPVVANDPNKQDGYKMLNRIDFDATPIETSYYPFYNAMARTEIVDEAEIAIPRGYYMTPFLKCNWVLNAIFEYLGYKLNDNFFTRTPEFQRLVFLNNTADAIVTGVIHAVDLLPSGNISDLLDVFRKRFRCEFIPNQDKTVDIVLFEEVIAREAKIDLSEKLAAIPSVSFSSTKKCIIEQTQTKEYATSERLLSDVIRELKTVRSWSDWVVNSNYISDNGDIVKVGWSGAYPKSTVIGHIDSLIDDMDPTEETETQVLTDKVPYMEKESNHYGVLPFIGDYRLLRSYIVYTSGNESESTTPDQNHPELDYMLCFNSGVGYYLNNKWNYGHITHGDYSLLIDGDLGIYKRFHLHYDKFIHSAPGNVEMKMNMNELLKMSISPIGKIMVNNQEYLMDTMQYAVGSRETSTCVLKSISGEMKKTNLLNKKDKIPTSDYYWVSRESYDSKPTGSEWGYDGIPTVEYFDAPTKAEFDAGGKYHQRSFNGWYRTSVNGPKYPFTINVWLEARKGENFVPIETSENL